MYHRADVASSDNGHVYASVDMAPGDDRKSEIMNPKVKGARNGEAEGAGAGELG